MSRLAGRSPDPFDILARYSKEQVDRLLRISNERLHRDVAEIAELAKPSSLFVHTGSPEDREYVRRRALERREELPSKLGS